MNYDPIPDLQKLGYAFREACFLCLVGLHSGYFLRRQFNRYIERELGAMSQQFVEKARRMRHIRVLDYGQKRYVFHLSSGNVYDILGQEHSPHQRPKADSQIKSRLMTLDYVLDNPGTSFLADEEGKLNFFCETLEISHEVLPRKIARPGGERDSFRYFPEHYPIAVLEGKAGKPPLPSFAFIDEGNQTIRPFRAFLRQYAPLFISLRRFEVVYVSDSERNFQRAGNYFHGSLRANRKSLLLNPCPRGVEHFLFFLKARRMFDEKRETLSLEQYQLLREGERLYTAAMHEQIYATWRKGTTTLDQIRARFERKPVEGFIRGYLMKASYPFCGPRYRGV